MGEVGTDGVPPAAPDWGPVTRVMVDHLGGTRSWVRLMSVVMFVVTGLMVVGGLVFAAVSMVAPRGGLGIVPGVAVGLLYVVMAGLYFFPALFLSRYAGAIRELQQSRDPRFLEAALLHQKAFWRLVGIMTVCLLVLYALILVGMVLAAMFAAVMR